MNVPRSVIFNWRITELQFTIPVTLEGAMAAVTQKGVVGIGKQNKSVAYDYVITSLL